jgi:hypothetical protein
MESIVRDVRDIDATDRRALEHVLGLRLGENQRVMIQVLSLDADAEPSLESAEGAKATELPDWCRVYEGLSDSEIAEVEDIVLKRTDLHRPS